MADNDAPASVRSDENNQETMCRNESTNMKRKKIRGEEYVSTSKKFIPAKTPPTIEDSCKCYRQCSKISFEQKLKLFHGYYKLDSNEKQGSFLMGLMSILPIKRRRNGRYENAEESKRQCTVSYTLPDGTGNLKQVCRKTFAAVFDIKQKKMAVLVNRLKKGDVTYEERRGNKTKFRKFRPEDAEAVKTHVASFPREESHYGRARSQKEYLSPDLNMSRLFKAFKLQNPNTHITLKFYSQTFKKYFKNVKFGRKRTDTCSTCDLLSSQIKANAPNKEVLKVKLEIHQRKANKALDQLSQDASNSQMPGSERCVATIDLEQVFATPTLTHSQVYYSRQLSNFNLGIHITDTNDAYMNVWHEGVAGRGGNEIASCIKKVFCSRVTSKKNLTIWSDNCAGQNKNRMIVLLWMYLLKLGIFDEIQHKFLITGHSYLPCDRDFGLIEKRKRKCSLMVPSDLIKMIREARDKPFTVNQMTEEDFLDFQTAADLIINTNKLSISTAQWIKIKKSEPHKIRVRRTLNSMEAWKVINVLKRNKTMQDFNNIEIPQLRCQSRISDAKKKDLLDMVPYLKNEEHRKFYTDLLN